jgi:hypothetical protein
MVLVEGSMGRPITNTVPVHAVAQVLTFVRAEE